MNITDTIAFVASFIIVINPFHPSPIPSTAPPSAPPQKQIPSSSNSMKTILGFIVASLLAGYAFGAAVPKPLEGMRGVVGVIAAEGKAELPLAIAKNKKLVVHCITAESADAIRNAADKAGLGGLVIAESLPVVALPYRDNLLNALVVEDWAVAQKQGLTQTEALRVVAPGGTLCLGSGKGWELITKKRPAGMDEWTHNYRDAGGNSAMSEDKLVTWPFGVRWHEDLPFNISNRKMSSHQWTNTRGLNIADGRIYYLTTCARGNLHPTYRQMSEAENIHDQYLTVRDAWNGALLWRHNLGPIWYGNLLYSARAPLVTANGNIFAANKKKQLMEFDGKTGKVLRTFETKYTPSILLVLDNVLVVASWKEGDHLGSLTGVIRQRIDNAVSEGAMFGFDLKTGKKLWENTQLATSLRAADGRVYFSQRSGRDDFPLDLIERNHRRGKYKEYDRDPKKAKEMEAKYGELPERPQQRIVALNVKTGKELWSVGKTELKLLPRDHVVVDLAGVGSVVVAKNVYALDRPSSNSIGAKESITLDGKTGNQTARGSGGFAKIKDGKITVGGSTICTPTIDVNEIVTQNRSNKYVLPGGSKTFGAARGSCMFAAAPANGALYTPQTWCRCAPGVIPGFVSFGPVHKEPTGDEMRAGAKLFKGPAYGKQATGTPKTDGWRTYLANAQRSSSSNDSANLADAISVKWTATLAAPIGPSNIEESWKESLQDVLTAPVVADGLVFVADRHRQKVIAVDRTTGEPVWQKIVGGRVNTPPTVYQGLCLFGCDDGYVYALDSRSGELAWKMRMGPEERRLICYGQTGSPWSVFSSVVVAPNGVAYASAGKTTAAEGGIVIRAFDPATGKVKWSQVIAYLPGGRSDHTDDVMMVKGNTISIMKTMMDLETGKIIESPMAAYKKERQVYGHARHLAGIAKRDAEKKGVPVDPKTQVLPEEPKMPMNAGMVQNGTEGYASSHWTRLGDRRRSNSVVDGAQGVLLSWDPAGLASSERGHIRLMTRTSSGLKNAGSIAIPDAQVTGIAMDANHVVSSGGLYPKSGKSTGFVQVNGRAKGELLAKIEFPSPLSFHGIALDGGDIFITLKDGTLVCLGGTK